MKSIYLIIFFTAFTLFADAQVGKMDQHGEHVQVRVIKFYPNPATTVINFDVKSAADNNYSLQIFNFIGKKVFELSDVAQKNTIPLSDFFRGVYIFQLRDRTGKIIESGKFHVNK